MCVFQGRATARDAAIAADQRANELTTVKDEQRVALESADRARKAAEHDKLEATDRLADIQDMYNKAATGKSAHCSLRGSISAMLAFPFLS